MSRVDELIISTLASIREDIKEISETQQEHSKTFIKLEANVDQNTKDLSEHIAGVKNAQQRLELLERPAMLRNMLFKIVLGSGALSGATYSLVRLYEWFNG